MRTTRQTEFRRYKNHFTIIVRTLDQYNNYLMSLVYKVDCSEEKPFIFKRKKYIDTEVLLNEFRYMSLKETNAFRKCIEKCGVMYVG